MGNYISCALSTPTSKNNSSRGIKVIFPTGEIQDYYQPIKAAELMLETPNHFLVNSQSLHVGRRFSALNADEDLEIANAYVMFPMRRLNSVITAADVGALFLTAKRVADGKMISASPENFVGSPESTEAPVFKLILDDIEELSSPEFKQRLSMCRSKKPLLETIAEEPIYSR